MDKAYFQEHVLDRSHKLPVVVDFWAEWCGPCKVLGPVIEALAEEADGNWELVKVNTEESEELSREYQIMSIPAVKMFHQGEIIAEFAGALPKTQIERWLQDHFPHPGNKVLNQVYALLDLGNHREARDKLNALIEAYPDFVEAKIWLAKELVWEDFSAAEELLAGVKIGQAFFDEAEDIRIMARLLANPLADDPSAEHINKARSELAKRDIEEALKALIQAIMINKSYQDELARKSCIAIFHILGEGHPLSKKYRPRFSMALY